MNIKKQTFFVLLFFYLTAIPFFSWAKSADKTIEPPTPSTEIMFGQPFLVLPGGQQVEIPARGPIPIPKQPKTERNREYEDMEGELKSILKVLEKYKDSKTKDEVVRVKILMCKNQYLENKSKCDASLLFRANVQVPIIRYNHEILVDARGGYHEGDLEIRNSENFLRRIESSRRYQECLDRAEIIFKKCKKKAGE